MPPKPSGKKGDVEDFSDVSTLPQANIFKFTLVQKSYLDSESREKIRLAIKDKLVPSGAGRIQALTREDIVTYGKAKQIILDAAQITALPADDPRKQITETDMMARAAADRIFELKVLVRRQRQTRLSATQADENEASENIDGFIYMVDYPSTRAEILALSKYSQSLNAVFEIEEIVPPVEEGDEDEEEATVQIQAVKKTPDSEEARAGATSLIQAFISARSDCDVRSGLRNLAMLRVPFINQSVTYSVTEADGSNVQKTRSAEDNFISELISKSIDKYGQYFVQYFKFKKLVTVTPLVPDRESLKRIEELKKEAKQVTHWLTEGVPDFEMAIKEKEASKVGEDDKDELAKIDRELNDMREQLSQKQQSMKTLGVQCQTEIEALQKKSKRSLDDDPDQKSLDLSAYQNDFVKNSETSNNISSVLSAMITHIEVTNKGQNGRPALSQAEPSTADETNIDDLFESFANEIAFDLSLRDRGLDQEDLPPLQTVSSKMDLGMQIHDQINKTLEVKQTVPAGIEESELPRLNKISAREQTIFSNLRVPGKNRDSMPSIPNQSQRQRDAENPAFYPFCTLPVDEAERMLQLRTFQQMIKSNYIDQGKIGLQKHNKYQIFGRNFENHMSMDIFSQVYADALLDEPEITSIYYPRTDSLLVALFNKMKVNGAQKHNDTKFKVVSQRELPLVTDDADGEKLWRASYRVMPDFENWLAIFADELIQEQELPKAQKQENAAAPEAQPPVAAQKTVKEKGAPVDVVDPNAIPVTLMKYVLDEEALPSSLINLEDAKIQQISEKSALMYPDDNSIIRVDHFGVGGQQFSKSVVIKDNFRFGLRSRAGIVNQEPKEYGLIRQIPVGDTEFYLHFENGTKMGVEQIQMQRNPQKTIMVMPPPPTPEEIAYKLEQQKKFAEASAKAQKTNKPMPTDIEIPKTPQPTWETAPLNYLDTLYVDAELEKCKARSTLTFKNGLIVQYLGNGHVLQMQEQSLLEQSADAEVDRLCTKEGIIIRQFPNMDVEMLFPDGVHAVFSKAKLEWIVTNNKGMQRRFKDGKFTDLQSIPCAVETDAVTGAKMMIREDEIVSVTYKDGSMYCQHRDGTKFHTSADQTEIRVEKRNFASHIIKIDKKDAKGKGPYTRTLDRRVLETYLPDGSKSQTFLDHISTKKESKQVVYRTMISRSDLSIIVSDSLGHVSVITSNTRDALNELGEKTKMGERDIDYLQELARLHGHFTPQVYQAHINSKPNKSTIKTKNTTNDTVFVLKSDMTVYKVVNGVVVKTREEKQQEKNAKTRKLAKVISTIADNNNIGQRIHDLEIEEVGGFVEPNQKSFVFPRLFVVNNDGSAKELLSRFQLAYEIRQKGLKPELSIKQLMSEVFNNQFVENTYFLTKVINMEQVQLQQQVLNGIELPENAKDALKGKLEMPDINLLIPRQQQYLFSQIFKMPECDSFNQQAFANDYQRYMDWRLSNVRYETEFGIVHVSTSKDAKVDWEKIEDEEQFNKRIGIRILKSRAQPRPKFQPIIFKESAMKDLASSKSVKEFRESNFKSFNASHSSTIQSKKKLKDDSLPKKQTLSVPSINQQQKASYQRQRVNEKLDQLNQMKTASDFIPDYFGTEEGQEFTMKNPPKPLSQEAIIRMQQRLERQKRSQYNMAQNDQAFDGEQQLQQNEADEARDNPIVALEPDELKQGSHFTGSKKERSLIQGDKLASVDMAALPSLYMQEKLYIYEKEQENLLKSEEHHIVKTKDFNVYGRLREEKPFVKSLAKSTAQNELNEKFITTECITDRRVKISSQAPRFYINAPSVEDVRKQGQHQMILSAIEKKQTFGELINQANSMVTGVLHDSLKRSLQVMPGSVVFGSIRPGTINDVTISIKNEDSVAHRITIKPMSDKRIIVKQEEYGIIAPGMSKILTVSIRVAEDEKNASIKDTIQIVSKHDIFKIPVSATIISEGEFVELNQKQLEQTGKSIQSSRVRERLLTKIAESKTGPNAVVLTSLPAKLNEDKSDFGDM